MPDINIGRFRGGLCVYWNDPVAGRRRYQLEARTRKAAEAEALDVYRRKTLNTPQEFTISDLWGMYRDHLGSRPTSNTLRYIGKAVLLHFGGYRPDQLTLEMCRDYARRRLEAGKSQGTVHTELGHLRSALLHAQSIRLIDRAPSVWRPAKPDTDKRILSREEANSLIEHASDPHIRLAILLLLGTAARVGAILDLTWDRVNFDTNSINLRLPDSVTRKGRANVPMNRMVREALLEAQPGALSDHVIEYGARPIKSIRNGFKAAVERAGLDHLRIHDIRHTAAVTMLSQGIPIDKVAQMLGHSNTAMTFKVYGRYLPQHMQDAADVLDFSDLIGVFRFNGPKSSS